MDNSFPKPPLTQVSSKCYRLIPSRFPPIQLFEDLLDSKDLEAAYYIESLTNPRLRDQVGDLKMIPDEERICGPGSSVIMAAFTHVGNASRFTDGSYGIYYAAQSLETAIKETAFHRSRFLKATNEPPTEITMRSYVAEVISPLHDVRAKEYKALCNPDLQSYQLSQPFGKMLRDEKSWGIVYPSARHQEGLCFGLFRTMALTIPKQGPHFRYCWNGESIKDILEVKRKLISAFSL